MTAARDPVADLRAIAFELERLGESTYRVRAFRGAAASVATRPPEELRSRANSGTLAELPGVGQASARSITQSLGGACPEYLTGLLARADPPLHGAAAELLEALRGDCHAHTDWSDGGSPIEEMALAAVRLGHSYLAITDHSPRLTVAHGLTAERLRRQLDRIAQLNEELDRDVARTIAHRATAAGVESQPGGFRLLTGVEVDILEDGSLDQDGELLDRLDVVVASVHSALRAPSGPMTRRMLAAVADPRVDVLGHCTGRIITPGGRRAGGRTRPESEFDAEAVFAACAEHGTAVEINCRPERLDPPRRLLRAAVDAGCRFFVNTDAHAPGQLTWQRLGCVRAAECGVTADRVVNTRPVHELTRAR